MEMRIALLVLSTLSVAVGPSAFANDITYSTGGSFFCPGAGYVCSGNTLTGPNGLVITFTGQLEEFPNVSAPPASYAAFGTFTVSGELNKNVIDTIPSDASFVLSVFPSAPTPGTETLTGQFAGGIKVG